jgi:hypothetical protein
MTPTTRDRTLYCFPWKSHCWCSVDESGEATARGSVERMELAFLRTVVGTGKTGPSGVAISSRFVATFRRFAASATSKRNGWVACVNPCDPTRPARLTERDFWAKAGVHTRDGTGSSPTNPVAIRATGGASDPGTERVTGPGRAGSGR